MNRRVVAEPAAKTTQRAPLPRAGRHAPSLIVFMVLTAVVLTIDLALKTWSFAHVAGRPILLTPEDARDDFFWHRHAHDPVVVVPNVLSLRLMSNTGAVFGLGRGARWVFIAVGLAAAVLIPRFFWVSRPGHYLFHAALALILAGALGNLYDRLVFHAVRDMLYLFPGVLLPFGLSWPGGSRELYPWIFNLADAALLVGVALLFILTWRQPAAKK